jgi:hypothetical protein
VKDDYTTMTLAEWAEYAAALAPTIQTFTRQVYLRGLSAIITACPARGMQGTFGAVTLRSFGLAGRRGLTFAEVAQPDRHVTLIGPDALVSAESPEWPLRLHTWRTDAAHAARLIRAVCVAWPTDPTMQAAAYQADDRVTIA